MFSNQLKTIIGKVLKENIRTETGIKLGGLFGAISVGNRIVGSPYINGMGNVLSRVAGKRIVQAYRGQVN